MRIREENCNMLLLATVTAFSVAVAGVASVLEPEAERQAQASTPVDVADQTPVRVIGPAFVPNTNPSER
jgi:hypothetical protein